MIEFESDMKNIPPTKCFVALAMIATGMAWAATQEQVQRQATDLAGAAKAGLEAQTSGKVSILALPPNTVVAVVDSQKVTAGMVQAFLRRFDARVRQQLAADLNYLILRYAVMMKVADAAERDKLDQQSPWRDELADARIEMLYQAGMDRKFDGIKIAPEDVRQLYDRNQDQFKQAKVKAIYIPFRATPGGKQGLSEAEAKGKIERLLEQARSGADFGKLARANSGDAESAARDGDFGAIARNAPGLPDAIKDAVLSTKAGQITGPLRHSGGFYIFRIEEIGNRPFDQVRQDLENQLRQVRMEEWLKSLEKDVNVKMEGRFSNSPTPTPAK